MARVPLALARPAVSQARTALAAHEDAVRARCARLLEEEAAWAQWLREHPDWDPGAWDALPASDKRKAIKAGAAPPSAASTWRDERAGDGSRQRLHIARKRSAHRAVHWDTAPTRVDHSTLSLPGLGPIEVVANNPLPAAERLRSARVCVRHGRRGRTRVEVHLSVRIDVVPRTKRPRRTPLVAGADMGCADTVTLHEGKTLTLPDHGPALERAVKAQTRMNACVQGSRRWRSQRETVRHAHGAMRRRDRDAIAQFACALARRFDVVGLESLQIKTMTGSARARGRADVEQTERLNRAIRRACWGLTQAARSKKSPGVFRQNASWTSALRRTLAAELRAAQCFRAGPGNARTETETLKVSRRAGTLTSTCLERKRRRKRAKNGPNFRKSSCNYIVAPTVLCNYNVAPSTPLVFARSRFSELQLS